MGEASPNTHSQLSLNIFLKPALADDIEDLIGLFVSKEPALHVRNAAPTMVLLREELNKPRILFVERESNQFHEREKKMSKSPTGNSEEKVSKKRTR